MSDLSLLNGVYAHVETYAVLIDKVIERLGRERTGPPDSDQKRLGQLLIDASD